MSAENSTAYLLVGCCMLLAVLVCVHLIAFPSNLVDFLVDFHERKKVQLQVEDYVNNYIPELLSHLRHQF